MNAYIVKFAAEAYKPSRANRLSSEPEELESIRLLPEQWKTDLQSLEEIYKIPKDLWAK